MNLKVAKAINDYKTKYGINPNTLYIGRKEWDIMAREASNHFNYVINTAYEDDRRLECNGLFVFVVNADTHFNVCIVEYN